MSTFYVCEAANLFAGDDGPDNGKHLSITNIQHPSFEEKTEEHHPGGSPVGIEVGGLGVKPLTLTFKLAGLDPQTMALFSTLSRFSIYGVVRDKRSAAALEEKSVVFGRLAKMSRGDFERGKLSAQDHEIREITHYEYYFNKQEIYYFDLFTSAWRVNGVAQKLTENQILRIA